MTRLLVSLAKLSFATLVVGVAALAGAARSADAPSFKGKTVVMVIGYAPGGGTDLSGRLIASFLGRHLPGEPTIVVQNIPGADGTTAMNYFVQQTKPDGLTLTMGSGSQAEPTHYRKPLSHFDPTRFGFVGGIGRGGSAVVISKAAEPRLTAADAPPVIMGTTSGAPRSNMEMAAWGREFLGWNLKWVIGYRGTNDLFLALERGEIDMSATGNVAPIAKLMASGRFKLVTQSGLLKDGHLISRPEFTDAPLISTLVAGKIPDPLAARAFDYWMAVHAGPEKWLALPPQTPAPILAAYRDAFAQTIADPEFIERSRKIADDFSPLGYADVESWMKTLGDTPDEAIEFISAMTKRQGAGGE
jgi:tripartite-type tricarboxylate transporter receptor subunit TctC